MPAYRELICPLCVPQLVCGTTLRVLDFNVGKEGTRITEPGLWMTTLVSRTERPEGELSVGCVTYPVERTVRPQLGERAGTTKDLFPRRSRTLR